ncbi:UDP-glucose 4-epimerase GalE [Deinococcus arcticus]|uniref:UDP-glucose 4-epimerase n=1 Tax=Deinococcus arcticus TaxID=2136176 RepID=A0A2T3W5H0_9DEIO|nr:UDP-glucose 4-epimerase GalE [Deinococcus arcticus]PTA67131.1 UDP-glucose 4-epimerase GalE [Deinococcus arcticus]
MKILVTGGAGYIGSTTCAALEEAGHTPVVLDSLLTGAAAFTHGRIFYKGDVADSALLEQIFEEHPDIALTIHFAARIIVSESVQKPAQYYRENVLGTLALAESLIHLGQTRLVFSSSASVYESPATSYETGFGVSEDSPVRPLSPYARTKLMTEQILADLSVASPMRTLSLRYFNPIGADPLLRSGPYVPDPSHVLGRLLAAAREQVPFEVTGTDYPTRDGTGLRDYIHVWDLAQAHVAAVEHFDQVFVHAQRATGKSAPALVLNVGTGQGVTVRELVQAFQKVSRQPLTVVDAPRRPGDTPGAYARIDRARQWLAWAPQRTTAQAIADALAWEERRPAVLSDHAAPSP